MKPYHRDVTRLCIHRMSSTVFGSRDPLLVLEGVICAWGGGPYCYSKDNGTIKTVPQDIWLRLAKPKSSQKENQAEVFQEEIPANTDASGMHL